jgi:Zn-dependent peptidase ImmA (M78 family)
MTPRNEVSAERLDEIGELAELVADEHFPSGRIDPVVIAESQGITYNYGNYWDCFDGLLEQKCGRFHIYCNLDRVGTPSAGRARFTLAHELGHYFIDEHRNALAAGLAPSHPSFAEYESSLLVEREADHFASNLLMPESRFRKASRSKAAGFASILHLADQFGTSITSTALRYVKLDLVPCALFKWHRDEVQWKWLSTEAFRARLKAPVSNLSQLPKDSATAQILRQSASSKERWVEVGSTVSSWFRNVSGGSFRNDILIEQAFSLGQFGALTLLFPEGGRFSTPLATPRGFDSP